MAFVPRGPVAVAVALAALGALRAHVDAQTTYRTEYCSPFNTGSGAKNYSTFQSNSLCAQYCNGFEKPETQPDAFAFAILQDNYCWCSNLAPADTVEGCTNPCPGFPAEYCGGRNQFGYLAIGGNEPSGTTGAAPATPTPAPVTPTPPPPVTVIITATPSSTSTPLTSPRPTSTSQSSSSTLTPTPTPTPPLIEAAPGRTLTVVQIPTAPPNASTPVPTPPSKSGGDGLGTGGAVGLAIGLCAAVAILAAAIFFYLRKRRQEQEATAVDELSRKGSSAGFGAAAIIPSRTMSENSRYVLGTDGRRVVEQWEPGEVEEIRRSRLIPVDQRLDPFSSVYQRGENKSRESVNTIRDDHDYSRRVASGPGILRATNPD